MWKLFQLAIFVAVVGSNIEWNWTPNGYLAALIGVGLAYVLTVALTSLGSALSSWRQRLNLRTGEKRTGHGLL